MEEHSILGGCAPLENSAGEERLRAFFAGEQDPGRRRDLNVGISDEQFRTREAAKIEAAIAELDSFLLEADEAGQEPVAHKTPVDDAEPSYELIFDAPTLTPFDKARERLRAAESRRDQAEVGSEEYHQAMAELADAKRCMKVEQDRATDPTYRKRRATDEWRAGLGNEEYRKGRRKVRDKPNNMTPKKVLDAMSPEKRAQHDRDKNAEKQWVFGRRKAGWTEERIEIERPKWWARRLAKRT